MEQWNGRVALVTGASTGIGAAIAVDLVENGMQVIGVARRLDKMQVIAESLKGRKGKFFPYKCDITEDNEVYKLFEYIKDNFTSIDVCVNNAALMSYANLLDIDPEVIRKCFNSNVVALCLCSKLAIALMREKKINGHIINIGSVMGHKVFNYHTHNTYTATKYAVTAVTEGLRQELRGIRSGIRVTLVSPGVVKTEMIEDMKNPQLQELWKDSILLNSSDISNAVIYILSTPPTVEINDISVTPTFDVKLDVNG